MVAEARIVSGDDDLDKGRVTEEQVVAPFSLLRHGSLLPAGEGLGMRALNQYFSSPYPLATPNPSRPARQIGEPPPQKNGRAAQNSP